MQSFFIKKLWPDFTSSDLIKIINKYKKVKEILVEYDFIKFKKRLITSIFLIILLFYFLLKFLTHLFFNCLRDIIFSRIFKYSKKIIKNKVKLFFANFIFVIYIFIFCIIFSYFSNYLQLKLLLFLILIGCISSDIGGFVIGKLVKGPKLTRISPNKTISGSIGSILFTIVIYSSFIFYLTNNLSFKTFL